MLNEIELIQVREYMTDVLPETLPQDSKFVGAIAEVMAERFPRRDEFARLADKVEHLADEFATYRQETTLRFEQVDQRFEQVDQRFEQVDQRFEQVDQRFEQVDQRFDKLDKNVLYLKRDMAKVKAGQERIIRRLDQQERWLKLTTGQLGDEKGEQLEDMVAVALRYGLENPDITPSSILLRQKLVDKEGLVFKRGFETEVDLIALKDKLMVFQVFEIKATTKASDVDFFSLKVDLIAELNPEKEVEGILISLGASQYVRQRCEKYGLQLVP